MYTSQLRLLKNVPLSPDYSDTFRFPGVSEQTNYFMGKTAYTFTEAMYIRDGVVAVENSAGDYRTCSYMMYTNPDFPNKWFYAFIIDVKYIADGTTHISYVEDVIQTWWWNFRLGSCLVKREHVANDLAGLHVKEEMVSYGEYKVISHRFIDMTPNFYIVASAVTLGGDYLPASPTILQGTLSGLELFGYGSSRLADLRRDLDYLAQEGKSDAIKNIWAVPGFMIEPEDWDGKPLTDNFIYNTPSTTSVPRPDTIDGYKPRNQKLFTYPYCGINIGTYSGQHVTLRWELFNSISVAGVLRYAGTPMPNGRVVLYPRNYAGLDDNYNYAVYLGDYPEGSWIQDVYSNWLATQSVKWDYQQQRRAMSAQFEHTKQFTGGVISALLGDVQGGIEGVTGMVENAINYNNNELLAQNAMAEEREIAQMVPPSVSGSIGSDLTNINLGNYGFYTDVVSITAAYARSIDNYFDMFVYRVDVVKVPTFNSRESWNYVQTVGAIVKGDAPLYAREAFKGLLDRGIRFWHTTDLGNFSLSNNVVG